MAGLMKELLLDYGLNRLSVEMRSDLSIALHDVLTSGVFSGFDILCLHHYIAGYSAQEIAEMSMKSADDIEVILTRILTALEEYSGYTDDQFIHKIRSGGKHRPAKIQALAGFLREHGKHYTEHEIA